jgi:hypothetical protein
MDTEKVRRAVVCLLVVNSFMAKWGCSCSYALEAKAQEMNPVPLGKSGSSGPSVKVESGSSPAVGLEKLSKVDPLAKRSWDMLFFYDSQAGSMMLASPEKQKDHGRDGTIVVDLRSNVSDLYAPKCRFLVPNDKGNDYSPSHPQDGAHALLPVPVFLPARGEYRYPGRSGAGGKEGELDVSQFGKDKSDVLQVRGNILLGVVFPEVLVTESALPPDDKTDAKKVNARDLVKFARVERPSNAESVLGDVVSLGLDRRYSLKVGSHVQESVVVYRGDGTPKRWFFFAGYAAKANGLIGTNAGCSFSLDAGFNGLVGCPFKELFADGGGCSLIDDYLFGGRLNYQVMNLDRNDGFSFSCLASQGWKDHVNGVGGVVAWPLYYGMPGVLVPPGDSVIFTTSCEIKGKIFVTHHVFLNRADTAICEKALIDGCSVEKSDDLARLARVILITGKECAVLRLCSMLLDSYPGGRFRDTFREAVAIHNAKRFTAAEAAEDARRKREAEESAAKKAAEDARRKREADAAAASRTAAAKAAEDARRKREADEAAAREASASPRSGLVSDPMLASKAAAVKDVGDAGRKREADGAAAKKASASPRSSFVSDSVSASKTAAVKGVGDAGRKREADARFVQKAAVDAKGKPETGATVKKKGVVAKRTKKATARRRRSANVAKKSTAASSKGKVSSGKKTRSSSRSMTVRRIRNRRR